MLTEKQKEKRLLGIGGSDVGYITGHSPYKTPLEIYLIKIGELQDNSTNESAYWGNKLEKEVANEYAMKKNVKITKPRKALVHPKHYWMRCNLDFVVKDSTIIGECKTAGISSEEWGDEGTDQMPMSYLLQCAHNAIVSESYYGTTQVDLPILFGGYGGHKHRIYTYHRNKKLEDRLIEIERVFWQEHVEKKIPPSPTSYKEATMLWPLEESITKVATAEIIEIINDLKNICSSKKELEKQEEEKKTEVCKFLEIANILIDSNSFKLATWKNQETTRLNNKALKVAHPEICNQFLETSTSRVLRIAK